ncbi:fused maltose transport subunit, ATP-binding component of ABC superfamily; regulatory protein [Paraburkholderia ribeironis]|uniref:Fused maltose transport subunit, ATP-binding component of ABC superfamily regulatory protein n=1 Tax=Paraburkholderia ribeironis TaxID=1247936 RepID=A0A1N7SN92_9BURK|nr:sn-glycerol-3-phosphate ABC transporter ATP-binding protein UgpC [Paraburkholderia ribeironis]SIT48908.1 fused maltose transport subunit, ATP-binding component of ABC superfamily; regulatory protein [Paraburkholderia ribeironis]
MAGLTLRNVTKRYDEHEVMRDINLDIQDGEFVVFVGPSGCGKSTLMRMIAGLEEISGGDLKIDGVRVNDVPPARRGIAMVFQSYALYPHMSLSDNMAFGLKLAGTKKPEIDSAVRNAAKILHIDHLLERKPKQLSGGQRQRVAIGRAITRKPKVFLFDEPLSNLDAALRVKMRLEFARLHDELKTTMIYVTHDQVEAMTLADKIVVLSAGNVEQVGTPNELYHAPANRFVGGFIGSPKMNFLEGTVHSLGQEGIVIRYATGQMQLAAVEAGHARVGDKVSMGVRPEHLHLRASAEGLKARVMAVESLGDAAYLYAESPVAPDGLIARIPPLERHAHGNDVYLTIAPDHCHVFDVDGIAFKRAGGHALAA